MGAPNASWLLLAVVAILLGGTIGTLAVLLRTPLRLSAHQARIMALETAQAHLEAEVKKALRRQGIAAKKARADAPAEPEEEGVDLDTLLAEAGAPQKRSDGRPALPASPSLADVRRAISALRR